MQMESEDGFTVVRGRRKSFPSRWKQQHTLKTMHSTIKEDYSGPNVPALTQKILLHREQLREMQFYKDVISLMENTQKPITIVCYGIGRMGTCHIAQQQFVLLTELMDLYKPQTTWLYDPVLYEQEKQAIRECGCQIMPRNEECKRRVDQQTLFYMPHCGKAMYNNLLWANWSVEKLTKIAIIGNSFNSYHEKFSSKQLLEEAAYIHHLSKVCEEHPFPSSYPDHTIFNDVSLHTFPLAALEHLDHSIWNHFPEPVVNPSDPEIVSICQT